MKALDLMRSADPGERVLALQRILGEDPLINPAPKPEQVPAIMDALSERVADIVARRNVEDSIEKKVNEKLEKDHAD
jgi:ATP-dependent Lon protease